MSLEDFKQKNTILFLGEVEVRLQGVTLKNEGRGMRKEVTAPARVRSDEA